MRREERKNDNILIKKKLLRPIARGMKERLSKGIRGGDSGK
jgi:hypothetical protein